MSATQRDCATCVERLGCKTSVEVWGCGIGRPYWRGADAHAAAQVASGAATSPEAIPAQPAPVANGNPAAWDLVMSDMRARDELGRQRYGVRLQPGNGRDTLRDAYEEALDLAVYLRTAIYERDGR